MAGRVLRCAPAVWTPAFTVKADCDFDESKPIAVAMALAGKLHSPAYHLLISPVTGDKTKGFWRERNNKCLPR